MAVPRYTPWFPETNYYDDFSTAPLRYRGHFIHEMMHVLQSQNGNWNYIDGPGLWFGNWFDYEQSYYFDVNRLGQPLWRFNMEQQARIVEYYYLGIYKGSDRALAQQTIGDFETQPPSPPARPWNPNIRPR